MAYAIQAQYYRLYTARPPGNFAADLVYTSGAPDPAGGGQRVDLRGVTRADLADVIAADLARTIRRLEDFVGGPPHGAKAGARAVLSCCRAAVRVRARQPGGVSAGQAAAARFLRAIAHASGEPLLFVVVLDGAHVVYVRGVVVDSRTIGCDGADGPALG